MRHLNKNKISKYLLITGVACFGLYDLSLIQSCGNNNKKSTLYNTVTGMSISQLYPSSSNGKLEDPSMVYVEGGAFLCGKYRDNNSHIVTVTPFMISKSEITNRDYNEFVRWCLDNDPNAVQDILPNFDTDIRSLKLARFNDQYFKDYFYNVAFQNYPVINVSWVQASKYCEWRSDRGNEKINPNWKPKNTTYAINLPSSPVVNNPQMGQMPGMMPQQNMMGGQMGMMNPQMGQMGMMPQQNMMGMTNAQQGMTAERELDDDTVTFRLPTEMEWEFVASGAHGEVYDGVPISKQGVYSWGDGVKIRGEYGEWQNRILSNFYYNIGNYNGVPGETSKINLNTDVFAFPPNVLGVFDLAGNVAEWVSDVYRSLGAQEYADFNPYRKNGDFDDAKTYLETGITDDMRVYKGASWNDPLYFCQVGTRRFLNKKDSSPEIGFRVVMNVAFDSNELKTAKKLVGPKKRINEKKQNLKNKSKNMMGGQMGMMNPQMGQMGMMPQQNMMGGQMGMMNPQMGQYQRW